MTGLGAFPPLSAKVLTVPGLCCSGPDHWQTLWERERPDCSRVELPDWDDPNPEQWVDAVEQAVAGSAGDIILAAHSLGCHAVAGWAARAAPDSRRKVRGALLVAPPDACAAQVDSRIARFAHIADKPLPFRSLLVASHDDSYATFERSAHLAEQWSAVLIDAGRAGHLNAASNLGSWEAGQQLLETLLPTQGARPRQSPNFAGPKQSYPDNILSIE